MSQDQLAATIDDAFARLAEITTATKGPVRKAVEEALDLLDSGAARVAEKRPDGSWQVNQWLKKAVLLSFRLNDMTVMKFGAEGWDSVRAWDKVPLKYDRWSPEDFEKAQCRARSCAAPPISRPAWC